MTERDKNRIFRSFTNSGCEGLNFNKCKQLLEGYQKDVNAPGCSTCAKRRARHKFRRLVRQALADKNFDEVWQKTQ